MKVGAAFPADSEALEVMGMNVVYLELHKRGLYLDAATGVQSYKLVIDYLRSQAADTSRIVELLAEARQELTR
ncbi:hypothetical protein [Streptomyces sp. NPDC001880]